MPPLFLSQKQHFRTKAFLPQEKHNLAQVEHELTSTV